MSTLSMHNAAQALPRLLDNLAHILRRAEANAEERGIEPSVFLNARLAPDMWPLAKQVQSVAEFAKSAPYRIAGLDAPSYEGSPASFAECYAVIERAKADFAKVTRTQLDGTEDREFSFKAGPNEMEFTGISYLSGFVIPNMHFHLTTVYNILRLNGVPLGKLDYFGKSAS
ncbi:DUF1993 family protein [Litorimonas sp. RW-G-Af-16]|uniref:DUF1993 domain-containing protein n=1 Tax=Litorimonas sp. RW-G-Af-16 TaxID=3241168 RepID=UPI00390CCE17